MGDRKAYQIWYALSRKLQRGFSFHNSSAAMPLQMMTFSFKVLRTSLSFAYIWGSASRQEDPRTLFRQGYHVSDHPLQDRRCNHRDICNVHHPDSQHFAYHFLPSLSPHVFWGLCLIELFFRLPAARTFPVIRQILKCHTVMFRRIIYIATDGAHILAGCLCL